VLLTLISVAFEFGYVFTMALYPLNAYPNLLETKRLGCCIVSFEPEILYIGGVGLKE
jgi:hypothetical protein